MTDLIVRGSDRSLRSRELDLIAKDPDESLQHRPPVFLISESLSIDQAQVFNGMIGGFETILGDEKLEPSEEVSQIELPRTSFPTNSPADHCTIPNDLVEGNHLLNNLLIPRVKMSTDHQQILWLMFLEIDLGESIKE
jgi:hypothetical protein